MKTYPHIKPVPTMLTTDEALRRSRLAAQLLLESHVCTVLLSCRADLDEQERLELDEKALRLRSRGVELAAADQVSSRFTIDEEELRTRSVGIARFVTRGDFCNASELAKQAVTSAVVRRNQPSPLAEAADNVQVVTHVPERLAA